MIWEDNDAIAEYSNSLIKNKFITEDDLKGYKVLAQDKIKSTFVKAIDI